MFLSVTRQLKRHVDVNTMKLLISAFILSRRDYCNVFLSGLWRDALETVINSRNLLDALGNPSTRRKRLYCPIWQITLYIIRQEQHYALLKNKKETYII